MLAPFSSSTIQPKPHDHHALHPLFSRWLGRHVADGQPTQATLMIFSALKVAMVFWLVLLIIRECRYGLRQIRKSKPHPNA